MLSRPPDPSVKKAEGRKERPLAQIIEKKKIGAPGRIRTCDVLLRSRVTTLIKTCRSEREAEDYQQVVSTANQLLAPSLSHLSSHFATICHK